MTRDLGIRPAVWNDFRLVCVVFLSLADLVKLT